MTTKLTAAAFTLAESVVSVLILALVLTGSINAYFGFDQNSENVKAKVRAENYARYLFELVDASPPDTSNLMPGTPFYALVSPGWSPTYVQDPSKKTADTGFLPWLKSGTLAHEIALVGTGSAYGRTFYHYRITATYNDATRTVYLTK